MEEWRDIEGYEGLYQVSNEGRVRTLDRTIEFVDGRIYKFKSKILSLTPDKDGYLAVGFSIKGKTITKKVHRLVAQAFIPNPNNYPIINHKDECKTNNFVENLEWCDCKYNLNYGTNPERISQRVRNNEYSSKKIVQIGDDGEIIKIYPSLREVERELGLFHSGVSACALGKTKHCGGFKWKFLKDMSTGGLRMENQ